MPPLAIASLHRPVAITMSKGKPYVEARSRGEAGMVGKTESRRAATALRLFLREPSACALAVRIFALSSKEPSFERLRELPYGEILFYQSEAERASEEFLAGKFRTVQKHMVCLLTTFFIIRGYF